MRLPDRLVLGRRSKAAIVAVFAFAALLVAAPARADDDHWIHKMVCAPYAPGSVMYVLLDCQDHENNPPYAD